jgi:hypothetical protein
MGFRSILCGVPKLEGSWLGRMVNHACTWFDIITRLKKVYIIPLPIPQNTLLSPTASHL